MEYAWVAVIFFFEKGVANALSKEWKMESPSEKEWQEKTGTVCLIDWAEAYLNNCQERFVNGTYKEKRAVFIRFFKDVSPETPVSDLTPSMAQAYLLKQKKERSGYASNEDRKNLLVGWNWGMMYMNPQLPKPSPFETPKMPETGKWFL